MNSYYDYDKTKSVQVDKRAACGEHTLQLVLGCFSCCSSLLMPTTAAWPIGDNRADIARLIDRLIQPGVRQQAAAHCRSDRRLSFRCSTQTKRPRSFCKKV